MKIETGKCAQCGCKLAPGFESDSCNAAFNHLTSLGPPYRPYFCSAECVDRAIADKVNADLDYWENHLETAKQDAANQPYGTPGRDETYRKYLAELKQFNADRPSRFESDFRSATSTYFNQYFSQWSEHDTQSRAVEEEKASAKRRAENAADAARSVIALQKRIEKASAEEHKLAAREAERQRVREERIAEKQRAEDEYNDKYGNDILTTCSEPSFDPVEFVDYMEQYWVIEKGESLALAPLIETVPDPIGLICEIYSRFEQVQARINLRNHLALALDKPFTIQQELKALRALPLPPEKITRLIFNGTKLAESLLRQWPITIKPEIWSQHAFILAPPGSGKTTLMEFLIVRQLWKLDTPAIVVIDPKGEMVQRLKQLKVFAPGEKLHDRLIVLDATFKNPPALNPFASAPITLPDALRERIQNRTIAMLEYVFGSADFKLTAKQSVGFGFLARLMFNIPNANLHTLLDVIDEKPDFKRGEVSQYWPYIEQLGGTAQRFFRTDFFGEFSETKSQLKSRIYMVLNKPVGERMFNASRSSVNWFDVLQDRKIVLVNTGFNLDPAASQVLARYVISSIYAAAQAREILPKHEWHQAFLFVDEAQLVVDETKMPEEIMRLVREYKLGITLATQQMVSSEFNDNIRNSISTNTSMKFAASVEGDDLRFAVRDLRTTPEFIQSHATDNVNVNFACYTRNIRHKRPYTVSVKMGFIEGEPKMPPHMVKALDIQMARRYGDQPQVPPSPQPSAPPQSELGPEDDTDHF